MSEDPGEDPVAHAAAKVTSYVSVAAMAAEAIAQMAATRAREHATRDQRTASTLRAERQAARAHARLGWSPMLDRRSRAACTTVEAGRAWAAAQPWRPDPEADRASDLAEDRLRELRPDVMARYDRLRTAGVAPTDAMRQVAPLFDHPPSQQAGTEGQAAAATASKGPQRRAAGQPGTEPPAAGQQPDRPAALEVLGGRGPVAVAGDGYPRALTAGTLRASRRALPAGGGRPPRQSTTVTTTGGRTR